MTIPPPKTPFQFGLATCFGATAGVAVLVWLVCNPFVIEFAEQLALIIAGPMLAAALLCWAARNRAAHR